MRRQRNFVLIKVAFALIVASAIFVGNAKAQAAASVFVACDGYGSPTAAGDGMTEYATTLGIFSLPGSGITERFTTASGDAGVASCSAALEKVQSQHWLRKVSLLRSRAIHYLEQGDASSALRDLDAAEAVASANSVDTFYVRSMALGINYVRAFAIRLQGDQLAAVSLARRTLEQRPFSTYSAFASLVSIGPHAEPADYEEPAFALARLWPETISVLFDRSLRDGRFEEALKIYPQLVAPSSTVDASSSRLSDYGSRLSSKVREAAFWAQSDGSAAYALAALGREADAKKMIDAARLRRDRASQELALITPPSRGGERANQSETDAFARFDAMLKGPVVKELDLWADMVERRMKIHRGLGVEVLQGLTSNRLPRTWASKELLESLQKELGGNFAHNVIVELNAVLDVEAADLNSIAFMSKMLPEPETRSRIPPYVEAKRPWFAFKGSPADLDKEGFRDTEPNEQGVRTVRYRGVNCSAAVAEELALLHASDISRQNEKSGMVIVGRRITRHSVATTVYGVTARTDPNGFEVELDYLPVDLKALPPQFAESEWRVLNAESVFSALSAIYIAAPSP